MGVRKKEMGTKGRDRREARAGLMESERSIDVKRGRMDVKRGRMDVKRGRMDVKRRRMDVKRGRIQS